MNNIKIMVVALVLVSFIPAAMAQTANTGTTTTGVATQPSTTNVAPVRQEAQDAIRAIKQEVIDGTKKARESLQQGTQAVRQELKTEAETLRANLQNSLNTIRANTSLTEEEAKDAAIKAREEARTTLQAQVESVKQAVVANREEFQAQLEARKEEAKQKIEAERIELQAKLQGIQDERKKQVVEKVAGQIQDVNIKYLDRLTTVVSNLEEILRGISSRADKAALEGKDVTLVRADIAEAETLIATVRGYITEQSGMTYPITVTEEANLGSDVSGARDRLHADLTILKEEVKKVHDAVRKAANELAQIPQVDEEPTAE